MAFEVAFFFLLLKFSNTQKTLEPVCMALKCYKVANGSWKKRNFYWGDFLLLMQISWTPVAWKVLICSTFNFAVETTEAFGEVCEWSWASYDLTTNYCWAVFLQGCVYVWKCTMMTQCETCSLPNETAWRHRNISLCLIWEAYRSGKLKLCNQISDYVE
jgi:hypothetical protein